jgi:phage terminase small subunit
MADKLTAKQQRFIEEYLIDLNATQAAIRAGYSAATARSVGSENLTKPAIAEALQKARNKLAESAGITAERVLKEYARLGFSDMRRYASWDGGLVTLRSSEEMTDDDAAAVLEVSQGQHGVKLKLHDKKGALDSMAKHLGMFVEKHEHSGENGGAIIVELTRYADKSAK